MMDVPRFSIRWAVIASPYLMHLDPKSMWSSKVLSALNRYEFKQKTSQQYLSTMSKKPPTSDTLYYVLRWLIVVFLLAAFGLALAILIAPFKVIPQIDNRWDF